MSDTAIRVENLSKRYRIGTRQAGYATIRETVADLAAAPFRRLRRLGQPTPREELIWALKDVSFEVKHGEVLGIIGRNGAGKTTLLKVLSRITEPTEGEAEMHGRVGSLLEVGTGFHPELTGRENIYLSGAILGMKRTEIDKKFDEIVQFAEIEKFLDTPAKRYSSGMYVRLAFAVAAHLEPEILLVDEVLAVGDAEFQKKCLGKIGDVAKEGRTVLFVSHNMVAVRGLCNASLRLAEGRIADRGEPDAVISRYLETAAMPVLEQRWDDPLGAPGNDSVRLHRARLSPGDDSPRHELAVNSTLELEFEVWNLSSSDLLNVSVNLFTLEGILVANTFSPPAPAPEGLVRFVACIPANVLNDRSYSIELMVVKRGSIVYAHPNLLVFEVHDAEREAAYYGRWAGVVRPKVRWRTELLE